MASAFRETIPTTLLRILIKQKSHEQTWGVKEGKPFLPAPRKHAGTPEKRCKPKFGLAPDTLLVAVRLGAFPAFMFVHLKTTFFLEIAHDCEWMLFKI